MDRNKIQKAVDILIEEGRKSFVDDCEVTMGECIGMALTKISDDCIMALEIAETFLEDWNWHHEVAVLNLLHNKEITETTLDYAIQTLNKSFNVKEWFVDPPTKTVSIEVIKTHVTPIN